MRMTTAFAVMMQAALLCTQPVRAADEAAASTTPAGATPASAVPPGATPDAAPAAVVPTAAPKIYALVAAVGEQFTVVMQQMQAGTRLAAYRTESITVRNNQLNRAVLGSLDKNIVMREPDSKRIYMTLPAASMDSVKPYDRENAAIAQVIESLRKIPERTQWETIIVATPAYKWSDGQSGIDGRIAGFGVYYQPFGNNTSDLFSSFQGVSSGEDSHTPENKYVRSNKYTAPFSFIDIWVLDPKTLAVLDKQQRFDNVKVFDPLSDAVNISQNVSGEVLAKNVSVLLDRSITDAVAKSDVLQRHGVVTVSNVKEADPQGQKK
jgi:hypothetical protein